jgi:3-isopropylmalate dehydrogenase
MKGLNALYSAIPGWAPPVRRGRHVLGVFAGEGIGEEIVGATLRILDAAARGSGVEFEIRRGGVIGNTAIKQTGQALTPEAVAFCREIFEKRGSILCGPGGARFVYDMRAALDLYCKLTPVVPLPVLGDTGVIKPETRRDVDLLVVREIASGVYLGKWEDQGRGAARTASHQFSYTTAQAERTITIALALAKARRRRLAVVLKPGGVPTVSKLWTDVIGTLDKGNVEIEILEVDNAAFQIIQTARNFDVVVAPNLFGDIISDVAGLLLGSRGLCCSGNYGPGGISVYNTGHGAAYPLAGRDMANPLGQLATLCMLLRISFGLSDLASRIENAVDITVRQGWRTADMAAAGCTIVGTSELARRVIQTLEGLADGSIT